jgi:hypothetical protein
MARPLSFPTLKDFMRRSKVLSLYKQLLRGLPPGERPLVRAEFRKRAGERTPAMVNLYIAEAERQLGLLTAYARVARAAPAPAPAPPAVAAAAAPGAGAAAAVPDAGAAAAAPGAGAATEPARGSWPWERSPP